MEENILEKASMSSRKDEAYLGSAYSIFDGLNVRSRLNQSGFRGLYLISYLHKAIPMAEAPMTVPGLGLGG